MSRTLRIARRRDVVPVQARREPTWQEVLAEDEVPPRTMLRRPLIAGAIAVFIGFGGFVGWAVSAELDSAAVATGTVIVDSKKKVVSHLEGGVLRRLLVREGDRVKPGQPLMELDATRARSELEQLHGERIGLLAKLARLRAEQEGRNTISFPEELTAGADPLALDVVADEQRFFVKRREVYEAKLDTQRRAIEQHQAEIEALESQLKANGRQTELVDEQLTGIRKLADQGFATRTRVAELEAHFSGLIGDGGEFRAQKAKAEQGKARARVELLSIQNEWQSEIAGKIQETQLALNDVNQRITSARDVLERLVVRSPAAGTVLNIQVRTPGSAVTPGEPLMDVVPENENMVVEAKMNLNDIDSVSVGAPTQVRLAAFSTRTVPPMPGTLTYVAADQTIEQDTDTAYYVVRAEVSKEALAEHGDISLYPGMRAELLIKNRPRKAIDYLLEPLTQSFNRAFREE